MHSTGKTATFQWHLISSFYDYLPWSRCGVAIANQPWSGAYEITSPTWALAHTTQFSDPGWRYTLHGNGVTMLSAGGSVVTRLSPDASDFSIVIEKMSDKNSASNFFFLLHFFSSFPLDYRWWRTWSYAYSRKAVSRCCYQLYFDLC